MPLVNVRLIEGVFTPEQKSEMIHQLTETMVRIEGENLRPVTWVIVEEVKSGDWGITVIRYALSAAPWPKVEQEQQIAGAGRCRSCRGACSPYLTVLAAERLQLTLQFPASPLLLTG